ncbi:MAG: hypothetical protein IT314_14050 [Anaerolineales bacterium]|nr:hypothetical protein [Anaerolineales bacterium]
MKISLPMIALVLFMSACGAPTAQVPPTQAPVVESPPETASAGTTLYISATMHIETKPDSWPTDTEAFLNFLQQTTDAGIRWSIGGDIGWLESAEDAQEIVQRFAAMGVQWDNHAHSPADFARIASILSSWGVPPTNVISGFLIKDFDGLQSSYTDQGNTWSPQVIWGGVVCPGHKPGCDDFSISLYRPASSDQFYVHDPNGQFIKLGGGSHQLADAESLAAQIAQGQYTYPVMGFTIMVEPETYRISTSETDDINAILAFVDRMNAYPFVRWATIQETAQAWVEAGGVAYQLEE